MPINKIVLLRHGESKWNKENRFTGWSDIDLSRKGKTEAKSAGQLLKREGWFFNYAFTSVLKRAIHTLWIVLDELEQSWLPVTKSWKLNERHYGALQGMNKLKMAKKYGPDKILQWRRDMYATPPALTINDTRFSANDMRYSNLKREELPLTENLLLTGKRVITYWRDVILPLVKSGHSIIIVAHGNSLRVLIKYLDNMSPTEIIDLNIPTAIPLVYEFDTDQLKPNRHYYLYYD
ncbi:MAG: 2,3-diphosphoglycerate-dependent phosphoglycerate mutase [Candidatus Dasytiphilus stammeri]